MPRKDEVLGPEGKEVKPKRLSRAKEMFSKRVIRPSFCQKKLMQRDVRVIQRVMCIYLKEYAIHATCIVCKITEREAPPTCWKIFLYITCRNAANCRQERLDYRRLCFGVSYGRERQTYSWSKIEDERLKKYASQQFYCMVLKVSQKYHATKL